MDFKLLSDYKPAAIRQRRSSLSSGACSTAKQHQVLLGVTGSGKTYTMAKVIEQAEPASPGHGAQQDAGGAALS